MADIAESAKPTISSFTGVAKVRVVDNTAVTPVSRNILPADLLTELAIDADDITDSSSTNKFTTAADISKLSGIETSATADQTAAQIKTAYEGIADTNAYDDAAVSKLAGIEAGANITDATNVATAGAVMESDATTAAMSFVIDEDDLVSDLDTKVPTQQSVKAYIDGGASGIPDVVSDTTPQLGGQLDVNGKAIGDGTLELIKFTETGSAINEITVANAATGNGPTISATGDDAVVDLNLASKSTGVVAITGVVTLSSTIDGRDLVTDGSKLDGIAPSATIDQTPAELLTAVKTVDGTGSGLDADLLDGIEAAALLAHGIVDVKGDILAATAADTVARFPVGTNGQALIAASGESTGLDWGTPLLVDVGAVEETVNTVATTGATETLDISLYGVHDCTMDQNCTFTFSNPAASGEASSFVLILRGAFTPTLPAAIDWSGGSAPTYGTPSMYGFSTVDGGTIWLGVQMGSAFA